MSNTPKIALAILLFLAAPTATFARIPGAAGSGNIAVSGIPTGPANAGGMNNVMVGPSGIGNASGMAPLPPPYITVPVVPTFK